LGPPSAANSNQVLYTIEKGSVGFRELVKESAIFKEQITIKLIQAIV
jgi:cell fate regulator YaaT (PSP1 superfamily)